MCSETCVGGIKECLQPMTFSLTQTLQSKLITCRIRFRIERRSRNEYVDLKIDTCVAVGFNNGHMMLPRQCLQ